MLDHCGFRNNLLSQSKLILYAWLGNYNTLLLGQYRPKFVYSRWYNLGLVLRQSRGDYIIGIDFE